MNNKAQSGLGMAIVVAIMLFISGMLVVNIIKNSVTDTRTDLQCSSASISDGTKMTCLIVDVVVPYLIVIVISVAGGLITSRFMLG